jgi:hypothetical protein
LIVCPWHAVKFDSEGKMLDEKTTSFTSIAGFEQLELIEQHGIIWTYAGYLPKIPIPTIIDELAGDGDFEVECKGLIVNAPVKDLILINHDYDHQKGTHADSFGITDTNIISWDPCPEDEIKSVVHFNNPIAKKSGWGIQWVLGKLSGDSISGRIENYFPGIVILYPDSIKKFGEVYQIHLHYPVDENTSYTSIVFFSKLKSKYKILRPLFRKIMENAGNLVNQEDAGMFNGKTYAYKPKKLRTKNEYIADYFIKKFDNWH